MGFAMDRLLLAVVMVLLGVLVGLQVRTNVLLGALVAGVPASKVSVPGTEPSPREFATATDTLKGQAVEVLGSPSKGSESAPVVMVEFSDFQCPYCGRFARDTLPSLEKRYVSTGQVRVVFRHLPLPNHQHAFGAAVASVCAAASGKFWRLHDVLFASPSGLSPAVLKDASRLAGLDESALRDCEAGDSARAKVGADVSAARALRLNTTPAFLIGRPTAGNMIKVEESVMGAQPLSAFEAALEAVLKRGA